MPALLQQQRAVAPPTAQHALVKAIVGIYDLSADVDAVIQTHYAPVPEVRFNDPLVHVTGLEDIKGQFRALQGAFRLAGSGIEVRSVTYGERHVVIDWRITYIVRGVPAFLEYFALTLPNITVLTLDAKGRVLYHDDHWSVHELVGGIPVLGVLYRGLKKVTGKSTSVLANLVWSAFSKHAATTTESLVSPSSTAMGSLGSAAPPSDASLSLGGASVERSARGISSGTVSSAGSGAHSSIASGVGEEDNVFLAASD